MRQIFEPFFTTKEAGKGTGMGLATVHGIVKQHDGWIEVLSAIGVGTTFRVYFPTAAPAVEALPEQTNPAPADPVGGHTVLLAEDDSGVRDVARIVLEEAGLRVLEACDGPSAFALWQKHHAEIDLLLTDMVMPGGYSGADLANRILAQCPDLPVIYSSGYSVTLFGEDRKFQKDVNYLPKPYVARELVAIVGQALTGQTSAQPRQAA
jgi:CheY-like chemotaxis protein